MRESHSFVSKSLMIQSQCCFYFRVTGVFACQLSLHYYPVDVQDCFIRMLSYSYPIGEMRIMWRKHRPLDYNREIMLPEMSIFRMEPTSYNSTYSNTYDDVEVIENSKT